jgi:hypothetical protein
MYMERFSMKKTLATSLPSLVLTTILFGSILNGSKTTTMLAVSSTNPSQECKDAAIY